MHVGAAFHKKWGLIMKKLGKGIPEIRNNGLFEPKTLNQKVPGCQCPGRLRARHSRRTERYQCSAVMVSRMMSLQAEDQDKSLRAKEVWTGCLGGTEEQD